jgi:hypothetical protein
MSLVTVLTVLEMERCSGELVLHRDDHRSTRATLEVASGFAIGGTRDGAPENAVVLIRDILTWKSGRFSFRRGQDRDAPTTARPIAGILVEAAQFASKKR